MYCIPIKNSSLQTETPIELEQFSCLREDPTNSSLHRIKKAQATLFSKKCDCPGWNIFSSCCLFLFSFGLFWFFDYFVCICLVLFVSFCLFGFYLCLFLFVFFFMYFPYRCVILRPLSLSSSCWPAVRLQLQLLAAWWAQTTEPSSGGRATTHS